MTDWGTHNIGDRVRFITDKDSTGTIVPEPFKSPYGGLRQDVRWDGSGKVTPWNPVFLVPINLNDDDIPDHIIDASGFVYDKTTNILRSIQKAEAIIMRSGPTMLKSKFKIRRP